MAADFHEWIVHWDIITPMPSQMKIPLAEKLKSLGVKIGTAGVHPPSRSRSGSPVQSIVSGCFRTTQRGDTFSAEQIFPAYYRHGIAPIAPLPRLETLAAWAGDSRLAILPPESFVYLDTETSGLSGGTGTYTFMVGVARFEGEEFHLSQFFMSDPAEEACMLEALADYLASAHALVTFNGKAFDVPLLLTRYTLHAIPNPLKNISHIDLLPLSRRLWRDRLPSRALKYIEENVLLAPRTAEEVPGYEIPYLYFDYLRNGDANPLRGVFYHNAMDVVAMAALLVHAGGMLAEPLSESIEHGLDRIALGKLLEDLGRWDTAACVYERGLEQGLPETDFVQAVRRLSLLQRRRGDLRAAVELWKKAAKEGHVYALVELAKYHEHHCRDAVTALAWTEQAIARVNEMDLPIYAVKHWMEELNHRQKRLKGKM